MRLNLNFSGFFLIQLKNKLREKIKIKIWFLSSVLERKQIKNMFVLGTIDFGFFLMLNACILAKLQ